MSAQRMQGGWGFRFAVLAVGLFNRQHIRTKRRADSGTNAVARAGRLRPMTQKGGDWRLPCDAVDRSWRPLQRHDR